MRNRGSSLVCRDRAALPLAEVLEVRPTCMGLFLSSSRFGLCSRFFVRSGKAVLRSLIALQVAREFFPLEAVSSPWPVDRRAKDPSLALGQACPGSEQEGPARGRAVPSQATERRAREVACLPTGASLGGTQPRFLNKLRPAGVMVLSAVCPMRASRNLASGRRAPLCPVRDQRGERVATKNAGLPCLVPAGRAAA